MAQQYFSPEGLEKLKKELEERKGPVRADITRRILEAKELGDLSENAEYTEAKELQGFNEGRIAELEEIVKNAVVIGPNQKHEVITVGSTVKAESAERGEQKFTIVGAAESDPAQGFISNESPLGMAFLGRRKGEEVEVKTPSGVIKYKILEIL
jgi:transcription elongation factor GreA